MAGGGGGAETGRMAPGDGDGMVGGGWQDMFGRTTSPGGALPCHDPPIRVTALICPSAHGTPRQWVCEVSRSYSLWILLLTEVGGR